MSRMVSSAAMARGLVLLVMAVLTPAMSSAQDSLHVTTDVRLKAKAVPASMQRLSVSQIRQAVMLYPLPTVERTTDRTRFQDPATPLATTKPRKSAIGWAIAIGVGAGLAASAIAASKYGENEGGQFCGRCFLEWSAITLPAGAGAGALVGYVIDQSRK